MPGDTFKEPKVMLTACKKKMNKFKKKKTLREQLRLVRWPQKGTDCVSYVDILKPQTSRRCEDALCDLGCCHDED